MVIMCEIIGLFALDYLSRSLFVRFVVISIIGINGQISIAHFLHMPLWHTRIYVVKVKLIFLKGVTLYTIPFICQTYDIKCDSSHDKIIIALCTW